MKRERVTKRQMKLARLAAGIPVIHNGPSPLDRMPMSSSKAGHFKKHPVSVRASR